MVATWEDNYLAHHGIKGQKWGVRRYQNEDGTLTAEGKARFESLRSSYAGNIAKKNVVESGVDREKRLFNKIAKARVRGRQKRTARLEKKLIAQQKANDAAKKYIEDHDDEINRHARWAGGASSTSSHTSLSRSEKTGRVVGYRTRTSSNIENNRSLRRYHKARARGASPVRAFFEAHTAIAGTLLRTIGNKRKYGKALIYSDIKVNDIDSITTSEGIDPDV